MGSFPSTRNQIVARRSTLACRSMREIIPYVRLGKRREESLFLPRTPFVVQCSQPLPDMIGASTQLLHFQGTSGALSPLWDRFLAEDSMNILVAIKREERKLEKQLGKLQKQLEGVRAAGKALGNSAGRELSGVKRRVLSEAGRAKIAKAAKKRWAKVRAQAKKAMK